MKSAILTSLAAVSILFSGCGKKNRPANASTSPVASPNEAQPGAHQAVAEASQSTHPVLSPVTQPVLAAWQEGDHGRAIKLFIEADWSGRPTFPASMAVNMNDGQIAALPAAERELKNKELAGQVNLLKEIVTAVDQAGRDTAADGKVDLSERCFRSLRQFGMALTGSDHPSAVQWVGRVAENMGKNGLAKIGK